MSRDILVLQATSLPDHAEHRLAESFCTVRLPAPGLAREQFLTRYAPEIRAIACTGEGPVTTELLAALPNLEIICAYTAGLDGIDTEAAAQRGIPVTNASHVLADDVADLALWLLLSSTRRLNAADRFVRDGNWLSSEFPLGRSTVGLKVGILGLGHIGKALAHRLEVMRADIAYCGRGRKLDVSYAYFPKLSAMAKWCEALVVCCPSSADTRNLVDAKVLGELGHNGYLVNISRGSVVNEPALVEAISTQSIAAAALDVFADEPRVPLALRSSNQTVLLPHIGSATSKTRERMTMSMVDALVSHFASGLQH